MRANPHRNTTLLQSVCLFVGAVVELAGQACALGGCPARCCLVGVAQGRHPWMIWLLCPILDSA